VVPTPGGDEVKAATDPFGTALDFQGEVWTEGPSALSKNLAPRNASCRSIEEGHLVS